MFPGIERRLGIADVLASCMTDERDPASASHSYADMIRARMLAIACGYEDCDDLDAGETPSGQRPVLPPYNWSTWFEIFNDDVEVLGWQGSDIPMRMY